MKKTILMGLILLCATSFFAQNTEDGTDYETLFSDAEDIDIEETVVSQTIPVPSVSTISFSGNTKTAGGFAVFYNNGLFSGTPAVTFSSSISFIAHINSTSNVHGSVTASFPGKIDFTASNLYLNTLMGNTWITVGKKSTSWGNSRIFNGANSSLASDLRVPPLVIGNRNPNIISDSGKGFSVLVRQSTGNGELALLGYTTRGSITTNTTTPDLDFSLDDLNIAFCYDMNIGQTACSILGRWYEKPLTTKTVESKTVYYRESPELPVLALEQKRTINGFDVYAQEQIPFTDNHAETLITAGFYRIWDSTPRLALNMEFQDCWDIADKDHQMRLGVDAGISRLGKKRSGKIAFSGYHNFSEHSGEVLMGYIRNNILPFTNLSTGVRTDYNFSTPDDVMRGMTALVAFTYSISY